MPQNDNANEALRRLRVVDSPIRNFNPSADRQSDILRMDTPRITPSSINDLMGCAAKFRRLRVDRDWPLREPILASAHGTAVHWASMNCYQDRKNGKPNLTNIMALAKDAVRRGRYPKDIDRDEQVRRVVEDVCAFAAADDVEGCEGILGQEVQGEFTVTYEGQPLYILSATLDRVLVRRASEPSRLIVRELKTGVPRVDLRVAYVILRVAKKLFPDFSAYTLEIDSFDTDHRVVRDRVDGKDVNGQHAIISARVRDVLLDGQQGHWPRTSGDACTYCPSRQSCAGLPAEEIVDGEKEIF